MIDPNALLLQDAAAKLRDLIDKVVFVGGATLGLHVTDPGAAPVRPTNDVDVITEITTSMEYFDFSENLRAYGFTEDSREGAPTCRWLNGGLILDVMPIEASILGFSNRWYKDSLPSARTIILPNGLSIRVISAVYFLGTKVEAFRGRGNQDYWASRDLEDCIAIIDGRDSILNEIASSAPDLRRYLSTTISQLLAETHFIDALPGYLMPDEGSQQRLPALLRKLQGISRQ
jgi:hypothetical protein